MEWDPLDCQSKLILKSQLSIYSFCNPCSLSIAINEVFAFPRIAMHLFQTPRGLVSWPKLRIEEFKWQSLGLL